MYPNENKIFIALLTGGFIILLLVIFFMITIVRFQRKKVADDEERVKAELNNLDNERERIAADLHDDLGATLSAIKLRLNCAVTRDPELGAIILFSEEHIDHVMQRLRAISHNMMPRVLLRQGIGPALKELVNLMTDSTSIKVKYVCDVDDVAEEKAKHIYRIAQEILNNIVKHSKATMVHFSMTRSNDGIVLHIKDNGIGFNKSKAGKTGTGAGLQNISARSNLLKATIYLTTTPGKGVNYVIQIPQ